MPVDELQRMFHPESIAVVGASEDEGSVGKTLVSNLMNGFKGRLYPVNPNREKVFGLECFSDVRKLDGLGLSAATQERILRENGARLLGLPR